MYEKIGKNREDGHLDGRLDGHLKNEMYLMDGRLDGQICVKNDLIIVGN